MPIREEADVTCCRSLQGFSICLSHVSYWIQDLHDALLANRSGDWNSSWFVVDAAGCEGGSPKHDTLQSFHNFMLLTKHKAAKRSSQLHLHNNFGNIRPAFDVLSQLFVLSSTTRVHMTDVIHQIARFATLVVEAQR